MGKLKLSRRTFLKGSAAVGLGGASVVSLGAWQTQQARGFEPALSVTEGSSLCNGCSSKCGLVATVQNGKLWTLRGNDIHPYSKGTICGRGHGVAQIAYSDERVTQPLRRNASGDFEPISWETAFSEIGEKVKEIIAQKGAEALSIVHDPRPSGKYYSARFMNALGSANVYTHASSCNLSKESGYMQSLGNSNFSVDFTAAKIVLFIGRSYGDGIRPSSVADVAAAAERGCRLIMVDPRSNNTMAFGAEWMPIVPGTDNALLMALCNVLIEESLYSKDFVSSYTIGFDEFAAQAAQYTPEWAEKICDIPADTIAHLARDLAKAAPAVAVEPSWRAAFGCAYYNSFDTARAVTAVNTLLGCWNQKGGALITSSPKAGKLSTEKFPSIPKPEKPRVGSKEYPLALEEAGTNLAAFTAALEGSMKGMFFYNSNAAKGYGQPKVLREAFEKLDLKVAIDVQMSETALLCDYVLPECSYLERFELPEFIGGKKHYVGLRTQVLDVIHPETKPCDEIFEGLAKACGVGSYFPFTVEELAAAQLETVGVSLDQLKQKGVIELTDPKFTYGKVEFKTPSGKFEFKTDAVGEAGLNPVMGYTARKVMPQKGEFHLIGGKQGIHSHTMTMNNAALNAISRHYNLERLWMNASDAKEQDIKEGDLVELSSSEHVGRVAVRVTERLKPGVLFLPTHYGGSSPYQTRAYEYGICMNDFIPFEMEPGVGSMMSQEVAVTVRKVKA